MKIILLTTTAFLFNLYSSFSQTVNDVPIKSLDVDYVEIVGQYFHRNKISIELDYGQETKLRSTNDTRLKDENGKSLTFDSMIGALNFMSKNGYDFVQAYSVGPDSARVHHYLLRKKK